MPARAHLAALIAILMACSFLAQTSNAAALCWYLLSMASRLPADQMFLWPQGLTVPEIPALLQIVFVHLKAPCVFFNYHHCFVSGGTPDYKLVVNTKGSQFLALKISERTRNCCLNCFAVLSQHRAGSRQALQRSLHPSSKQ